MKLKYDKESEIQRKQSQKNVGTYSEHMEMK